jgi:malate dehydrogenase (oxaloacetate-decarboxylating)(NADP+)
VARAAMESGVARLPIEDWNAYEDQLRARLGVNQKLMNRITSAARANPKRVVFAEADNYKILKAAQILMDEGICTPILLGPQEKIETIARENSLDLDGCTIINILKQDARRDEFAQLLYEKRQRRGMTLYEGRRLMRERNYYAAMMVETGEADACITGLTKDYGKSIIPSLQVIGTEDGVKRVSSMYIIQHKKGPYFFADTTVNINPTAEEMVEIIGLTARAVRFFDAVPRVAVISYSNFGSNAGPLPEKTRRATELAKQRFPDLLIDGEMQANVALSPQLLQEHYGFSPLAEKGANTLIFPNVESGNIAYKVLQEISGTEVIGPVLMGMRKPVHILQLGASVRDIVNMAAIAVVDAQQGGKAL